MKIKKVKLGKMEGYDCDFQDIKENFIKQIIKWCYESNIMEQKYFDYELLETRIVFLKDIMEQENLEDMWNSAYALFEDCRFCASDYDYKIYQAKSGIVWLVISNEYMNCESDIYITKNELKALGAK